jgi:hypothetical protein
MSPGLVILITTGVFVVLLLFLKWVLDVTWSRAGKTIEKRHRTAYRVLESGKAPFEWIPKRFRTGGLDDSKTAARIKRRILKRLAGEIRYFDNAAPFETLEAKRIFLHAIRSVETRWLKTSLDAFGDNVEADDPGTVDGHTPGGPYIG